MKRRVQEMEEEANKLKAAQDLAADGDGGEEKKVETTKSIYVGQVDYEATPEELQPTRELRDHQPRDDPLRQVHGSKQGLRLRGI